MRQFHASSSTAAIPLLAALLLSLPSLSAAQGETRRICEGMPVMKCLDKALIEGTTLKVPGDAVAIRKDGLSICDSSYNSIRSPDLVVVMDNTGSMRRVADRDGIPRYCDALNPEPLDTACISGDPLSLRGPALRTFLDSAVAKGGARMNAGVVLFAEAALGGTTTLQPLNAATVDDIKSRILMSAGGQTNYTAAFNEAYRLLKGSKKPKSEQVIIFVSDGRPNLPDQDNGGPYQYKEFLDTGIVTHTIFLGANSDNYKDMQDISAATGGLFFNITDVSKLAGILTEDIAKSLFQRATPSYTKISNLTARTEFEVMAEGHQPAADSGAYLLRLPGPLQLRPGVNEIVVKTEYGYGGTTQDVHFKIERTSEGPHGSWTQTCREPATLHLYNDEGRAISALGLPYLYSDSAMRYRLATAADIDSFDLQVKVASASAQQDIEAVATGPAARKDSAWTGSADFDHQQAVKQPGDRRIQVDHGDVLVATYHHPFIPEDSAQARARIKYGPEFDKASYWDLDGDGRIETVRIRWLENLGTVPEKLQFTIVDPQGTHERAAAGGEIKFAGTAGGGEDRSSVVVTLANPFPVGVTSVANPDSSGRTFRQNEIPLMDGRFRVDDSAAPVIVSAVVKGPDRNEPLTRVVVTYSEPVKISDPAAEPLVFKRDTVAFDATQIPVARVEKGGDGGREWIFHLAAGADFTPVGGDSVAVNRNGETRDLGDRAPKTLVFAPVQGGAPKQSISGFYVTFPNGSRSEASGAADVSFSGNGFIPVDSKGYPMPGSQNGKCQSCNPGGEGRFGGPVITVITKQPVKYEFSIFTNMGALVTRATGRVEETDLPLLEKIDPPGGNKDPNEVQHIQRIVWTGYAKDGQAVGTGAYVLKAVFKYDKSFKTGARAAENTRITRFGYLRNCCESVIKWYH